MVSPAQAQNSHEAVLHLINLYFKSLEAIKAAIDELVKNPELAYYCYNNSGEPLNREVYDANKVMVWLQTLLGHEDYAKCQESLLQIIRGAFYERDIPKSHWHWEMYSIVSAAVQYHKTGRLSEKDRAVIIFKWIINHIRAGDWGQEARQYFNDKIEEATTPPDLRYIEMKAKLLPGCTLLPNDCDMDALINRGPYRFVPPSSSSGSSSPTTQVRNNDSDP